MQPIPVAPWSPGLMIITFGELIASGAADGSFAKVEMQEDAVTEQVGEDGSVVVNQNMNELGQVTLRLLYQSPIAQALIALHNANRLVWGTGFRPITVADPNLGRRIFAPVAWVSKVPDHDYGDVAQPLEFALRGSPMRFI